MSDKFNVEEISSTLWDKHWSDVSMANLLQSRQYGEAKESVGICRAKRLLITDCKKHPVALAQVLVWSLPIIGGVARLNRGPLLLGKTSDGMRNALSLSVLKALLEEAHRRRWWLFHVAPEMPASQEISNELIALGLRHSEKSPWASGRLDLSQSENSLLMGLNGKWRNCLRKGMRLCNVEKVMVNSESVLNPLIRSYEALQQDKGFDGLSENIIRNLSFQRQCQWDFNFFCARSTDTSDENGPIGMLISVRHGDTSTYLIGTSNVQGRSNQANSVLLWYAILYAKQSGCAWFDIGGLNESTPKGIASFKKGLNAKPYLLTGEWHCNLFPKVRKVILF